MNPGQIAPPAVNGKPIDYMPPMAFDSPFIKSAWDSGVVMIRKGNQKLVLDFNKEERSR